MRRALITVLALAGVALGAAVVIGVVALTATPTVTQDSAGLARLSLPFGSGTVEHLTVVGGREQRVIPITRRGDIIWPAHLLGVHEQVTVVATVKRPGWISWLNGNTKQIRVTFTTPSASLRSQYLTVRDGQPLTLAFDRPVKVFAVGTSANLAHHVLSAAQSRLTVHQAGTAGTYYVAGAPRSWEAPRAVLVSYFPAGAGAAAVASPSPGSTIGAQTPISLTFSKPVSQVLGTSRPPVAPTTQGVWHQVSAHTIVFRPEGYGYGLGAKVTVALPSGVQLVGGHAVGSDPTGTWTVPAGSTLRLQQLLANLGYLPLRFTPSGSGVANTLAAQEAAAIKPPAGSFSWRYSNTPSALRTMWSPGASGEMTKGAIMAFENAQGMTADGLPGPAVWNAVLAATLAGHTSSFGYTFVYVSEGSPESINVWHSGKTVLTGPVNTGIAAAPTAQGVFAVYEHLTVTTMSGYNPDGSYYSDPGIPWVSYFNGGDALHGFIRASYGFPQSLGCVEMPFAEAGDVFPYTPIGTLVDVA